MKLTKFRQKQSFVEKSLREAYTKARVSHNEKFFDQTNHFFD